MTEIEQRRRTLSARLPELKVDALLVSSPANVRYLTGYTRLEWNHSLVPRGDFRIFFTDPRYAIASQQITCKVHVEKKALLLGALAFAKRKRLKTIGFESSWLSYEDYAKLKPELGLPHQADRKGQRDGQIALRNRARSAAA